MIISGDGRPPGDCGGLRQAPDCASMRISVGCTLRYQVMAPSAAFTVNVLVNADSEQQLISESIACSPEAPMEIVTTPRGSGSCGPRRGRAPSNCGTRRSSTSTGRGCRPRCRPTRRVGCRSASSPTPFPAATARATASARSSGTSSAGPRTGPSRCGRSAAGSTKRRLCARIDRRPDLGLGCLAGAQRGVPRLHPPFDRLLPRPLHPRPLCRRVRGRARPDELPRLLRGVPGRPLAALRSDGSIDPNLVVAATRGRDAASAGLTTIFGKVIVGPIEVASALAEPQSAGIRIE